MIRPAGDQALWIDLDPVGAAALHACAAALRDDPAVQAVVIGHSSLLVLANLETAGLRDHVRQRLSSCRSSELTVPGGEIRIAVSFHPAHAPDLPRLLAQARLSTEQFMAHVAHLQLRARYLGFLPGFAYLEGAPSQWAMPRLDSSRTRVAAGSFAIAGKMAAFYPADSPGGWNLIGRTATPLWRAGQTRPNLIAPGDIVTIVPEDGELPQVQNVPAATSSSCGDPVAEVIRPGQLTLIAPARDLTRYQAGLAPSGPFDEVAAAVANARVGNRVEAAVLEMTLVGPELVFKARARLALSGSQADVSLNGQTLTGEIRFEVKAGDRLRIGRIQGMRAVLAIQGGWEDRSVKFASIPYAPPAGEVLSRLGAGQTGAGRVGLDRTERKAIEVLAGPHDVRPDMLDQIGSASWNVTSALDRVGIRLEPQHRSAITPRGDLLSSGLQFGSVQWHPNGDLVIMGPDHPITGGYLQPVTVLSSERWKLAQLMPGDVVKLRVKKGEKKSEEEG